MPKQEHGGGDYHIEKEFALCFKSRGFSSHMLRFSSGFWWTQCLGLLEALCTHVYWPVDFNFIATKGLFAALSLVLSWLKDTKRKTTATAPHFQALCPGRLWQPLNASFGRKKWEKWHRVSAAWPLVRAQQLGKRSAGVIRPRRGWFCSCRRWGLIPPHFWH